MLIDVDTPLATRPVQEQHYRGRDIPTPPWTIEITPHRGIFQVPIAEMWRYRDLVYLFVRRDFVAFYKQTILGPLWFLLQPVMTTLMFTLVFGNIAGLSTNGSPKILFYLAGVTCWGYFSECLNKTATIFVDNSTLFGKVYFPRMISPLAIVISNLLRFSIQLGMFLATLAYFVWMGAVHLNSTALLLPVIVFLMASISLGIGLIFSALTTKYRDLRFLLQFGVQLYMYVTPVIYPVSTIPQKYAWLIQLNPLTPLIEAFRHGFLGTGDFSIAGLSYSAGFAVFIVTIGVLIFNRIEATFMDTV